MTTMFCLIVGAINFSPHPLSQQVGAQLAGWNQRARGPWGPSRLVAQSPSHRRDALPLLAFSHSLLFSRSTVFCHQSSDMKTAQSPTSPSHKYACAFPEPFSAPFSSPLPPIPAQVGAAMQRAFFFFFFSIQRPLQAQLDNFIQHARTC